MCVCVSAGYIINSSSNTESDAFEIIAGTIVCFLSKMIEYHFFLLSQFVKT